MKKLLYMLLLSPLVFSCTGQKHTESDEPVPDRGPVDVVLISGQSNGVGCTNSIYLRDTLPEKYDQFANGFEHIKIAHDCWTKDWPASGITFFSQNTSDGFVPVKLGQGNGSHSFGPEIGIADALNEKYGDKLFLIKFACGGSNLKDDWLERDSPMYPKMMKYVEDQMAALKKQGYRPTLKAFCWMQGEGDAYQGYYQYYKQNLEKFVSQLREDLGKYTGGKTLPFIDAGISGYEEWVYFSQVNKAKKEFAEESEYNFYFNTIQAGLHTDQEPYGNPDGAHYDSDSEVQLGHLFADIFEQFLEPVEIEAPQGND